MLQLPTRKTESFKYMDLSRLLSGIELTQKASLHKPLSLSCNMPSIHIMPDGLKECCLPQGVSIQTMAQHTQAHFNERSLDAKRHPMAAECMANPMSTHLIEISSVLSRPIELSFNANANGLWWNTLTYLQVDAGAEAEIEFTSDAAESNLLNHVLMIKVDDNAKLKINICRGKKPLSRTLLNCQIWQQRDSRVNLFYANDGELLGRYDAHAFLAGPGAEFKAAGFYKLKNKENVDHHILAEHLADNTRSQQFFKGIMDDQSTGTFNGAAHIHAGVKNADARQHNYNLLLSKQATINTKPELEVYTDVVTAAHGAAVGQLDEEALFYLQSRGLSFEQAKQLLIDAFFADVLKMAVEG